ncbi:unnamed protein product [Owenia fusiformis]|uniref:Uncharacterized protein n=1 Tax=Owenia fusiformis TaxID=6347 RepID=A0A8J1UN99_OWEFU|nr:unnamed protein product [Owenia fusiformis]
MAGDEETFEMTEEQITVVRDVFDNYVGEDVYLSVKKLGDIMKDLGYNLKKQQIRSLMETCDADGSGTLDFDEFLPLVAHEMKKKEDEKFYFNLFRILDKKKRGWIGVNDMRYILEGMSKELELTTEEIDDMITDIDEDGNGQVSFQEFLTLMTSE